jgi:hypothetical protein
MNEAAQSYIRSAHLTDILDLQNIARGVNMDITQLDPGTFESSVTQLKVRNVLASLITSNRHLRLQGNVDFLTVSFLTGESGSPKWQGTPVESNDVVAANPNETFDLVVPPQETGANGRPDYVLSQCSSGNMPLVRGTIRRIQQ